MVAGSSGMGIQWPSTGNGFRGGLPYDDDRPRPTQDRGVDPHRGQLGTHRLHNRMVVVGQGRGERTAVLIEKEDVRVVG